MAKSTVERQAAFAAKQRELGRKARKIWATDDEADRLRRWLDAWRTTGQPEPTEAATDPKAPRWLPVIGAAVVGLVVGLLIGVMV